MFQKVAIYGRVSTSDQTTENQILKLKEIVEINNWDLVDIYIDEGISGTKGRDKRPEFDREMISERVKSGLDRVRARGKKLGRPITVTEEVKSQVRYLLDQGLPYSEILNQTGVPKPTISRIKNQSV
jgi:DNA invertase Pin-like site-specific DNA recombinase